MIAPKLDLTKPMRCRNGCEVRILCTDGPGDQPIVGFVDGNLLMWCINGSYWGSEELEPEDLINVPEKQTVWVYEFDVGRVSAYSQRLPSGTICISCIRVEFESGRKDE